MRLSKIMSSLDDEAVATEILVGSGDLGLFLAAAEAGTLCGRSPGGYAAAAIRRFTRSAGAKERQALASAIERSRHPARTCLLTVTRWSLEQDERPLAPPVQAPSCCRGTPAGWA